VVSLVDKLPQKHVKITFYFIFCQTCILKTSDFLQPHIHTICMVL